MFSPILGPVAINWLNAEGDILSADYGNCAYHVQQGMYPTAEWYRPRLQKCQLNCYI